MASLLKQLMLWTILAMAGATSASAQEEEEAAAPPTEKAAEDPAKAKKKKKNKGPPLYYASLGLGKTLPEGFYRIRSANRFATGDSGYDANGKKENFGYDLTANVNAIALEYGMSDRFSFLLLMPYVSKNNVAFNKKKFRESARYTAAVDLYTAAFKAKLAAGLQAQGLCSGAACSTQVEALITNNATLPSSTLTLPTGETTTIPAAPAQNTLALLPELVSNAATPSDGAIGLSDVDFGITYSLVSTRTNVFALGVGVRMPFGKFEDVPAAQRPTGEGMIQLGIRVNYDYHPWAPLWLSFQNQSEIMLVEGKRKKSSLLNPNQLNKGDPTSDAAIAAGSDGDPNSQTVSRKGVGNVGTFRADLGLAKLTSVLQPMSVETSLNYELAAPEYYGETQTNSGEQRFSYAMGFKFDGLGLDRPYPAYIRVLREKFITGKNVPLATDSFTIEFAVYESF
ncbi:MAG TPA: hypothetical protein VE954_16095 [Oligoflexus sp.]|uniref:hypothetical protein n=1 Tax=Oligoflexus sp. TaxID=1971216 RepID=UPI002D4B7F36|nr:hypothetical protein [Oligoflexus sp.]HYX34622.1 hypothetical protein [Oligoflexus sp.]